MTRQSLIEQQTEFYEKVGKEFGLLRGEGKESGKSRNHLETAELKKQTEQELKKTKSELERSRSELSDIKDSVQSLKSDLVLSCFSRVQLCATP